MILLPLQRKLVTGFEMFLDAFGYLSCACCSAVRLVRRPWTANPKTEIFVCGHPKCVFRVRDCTLEDVDEKDDVAVLFPDHLRSALRELVHGGGPIVIDSSDDGSDDGEGQPDVRIQDVEAAGQQQAGGGAADAGEGPAGAAAALLPQLAGADAAAEAPGSPQGDGAVADAAEGQACAGGAAGGWDPVGGGGGLGSPGGGGLGSPGGGGGLGSPGGGGDSPGGDGGGSVEGQGPRAWDDTDAGRGWWAVQRAGAGGSSAAAGGAAAAGPGPALGGYGLLEAEAPGLMQGIYEGEGEGGGDGAAADLAGSANEGGGDGSGGAGSAPGHGGGEDWPGEQDEGWQGGEEGDDGGGQGTGEAAGAAAASAAGPDWQTICIQVLTSTELSFEALRQLTGRAALAASQDPLAAETILPTELELTSRSTDNVTHLQVRQDARVGQCCLVRAGLALPLPVGNAFLQRRTLRQDGGMLPVGVAASRHGL